MKRLFWILIFIVILGGHVYWIGGAYWYVFHKPHRDISGEKASVELQADQLVDEYADNQGTANDLYLDQVVEVFGTVIEKDSTHLKLEEGVYCNMHSSGDLSKVSEGDEIRIKGRVVGYDDLFEEVRMDNCTLVQ